MHRCCHILTCDGLIGLSKLVSYLCLHLVTVLQVAPPRLLVLACFSHMLNHLFAKLARVLMPCGMQSLVKHTCRALDQHSGCINGSINAYCAEVLALSGALPLPPPPPHAYLEPCDAMLWLCNQNWQCHRLCKHLHATRWIGPYTHHIPQPHSFSSQPSHFTVLGSFWPCHQCLLPCCCISASCWHHHTACLPGLSAMV